eukprot:s6859_g1.t1
MAGWVCTRTFYTGECQWEEDAGLAEDGPRTEYSSTLVFEGAEGSSQTDGKKSAVVVRCGETPQQGGDSANCDATTGRTSKSLWRLPGGWQWYSYVNGGYGGIGPSTYFVVYASGVGLSIYFIAYARGVGRSTYFVAYARGVGRSTYFVAHARGVGLSTYVVAYAGGCRA